MSFDNNKLLLMIREEPFVHFVVRLVHPLQYMAVVNGISLTLYLVWFEFSPLPHMSLFCVVIKQPYKLNK